MTEYTENYLILKPIAERFSRVAKEITDDDIKYIIKSVMKEKIAEAIHFDDITYMLQEWVDTNSETIIHAMQDSIAERIGLPKEYKWYS